jgi:hypothetical protein
LVGSPNYRGRCANYLLTIRLFRIFWAVSMPIAVFLIMWMFGKDIWQISKEYVVGSARTAKKWVAVKILRKKPGVETKKVAFGMA